MLNITKELYIHVFALIIDLFSVYIVFGKKNYLKNNLIRNFGFVTIAALINDFLLILSIIYISIDLFKIFLLCSFLYSFAIMYARDSLNRYKSNPWNYFLFGIYITGVVFFILQEGMVFIITLNNGQLSFDISLSLIGWIGINYCIQGFLLFFISLKILRRTPSKFMKYGLLNIIGIITSSILPFIVIISGLDYIIPGLTFLSLSLGVLFINISFAKYENLDTIITQIINDDKQNLIEKLSFMEKKIKEKDSQLVRAQKLKSIGTLATSIAHDFNNVLQIILGYTELIKVEESISEEIRKDLDEIVDATIKGTEITKKILDITRTNKEKFKIISLNDEVKDIVENLKRMIPKMIEIKLDLSKKPLYILGNPIQIQQIIMNLTINSRDAMPYGGLITISTKEKIASQINLVLGSSVKEGKYAEIIVRDTGIGMSEETKFHIFEPFFTNKSIGKGTGLGLFITYNIVKNHGGYIDFISEEDKGTDFHIYLPLDFQQSKEKSISVTPSPEQINSETILIVDDEMAVQNYIKKSLELHGYTTYVASNGKEALNLLESYNSKIDLMLLDMNMPIMGGKDVLDLLKLNINKWRIPKIIVSTGCITKEFTEDIKNLPIQKILNKPYSIDKLLKTVRTILNSD